MRTSRGAVIGCESDEPGAIPALIAAGLGADLLPSVSRRHSSRDAIAWLHLDGPNCRRNLRLLWRRGAYLSAASRAFRDAAAAWFGQSPRRT